MDLPIVDQRTTIDVKLLVNGNEIIVETPWAVSIMPTDKVINMIMAYGSLQWKDQQK